MKGNKTQLISRYKNVHTYVQDIDNTSAVIITDSQYIRCVSKKEDERSSPLDSIESIDFALRRRFAWKVIKPEDHTDMLSEKLDPDTCARALNVMTALNKEISSMRGLGSAYQIGPAYFLKLDKDHYNGDFTALWNMHIEVLLKEYLRVFNNADIRLEQLKEIYFNSLIEK